MRIISVFLLTLIIAASAFAQQNLRAGAAAPDFNSAAMDGTLYNLRELQGKIVVLTFWSTRCAICHHEIPKLNQMADRYRDKNVVFLALTNENEGKIMPYLRKNPFNFSILPNSFGVLLKYADMDGSGNIKIGFPAHFLIDRSGKIEHRTDGWDKASKLESHISRMVAATD